ncbi:MAG TPA: T9SS type A sorting domain-containing protein [Bacteroidota bacterium]|nr:T9SS type A sorting domain-containing protein [Bacteroidota bacterium]
MKKATVVLIFLVMAHPALYSQTTINFNSSSDLSTFFGGVNNLYTNSNSGGLSNSGAVSTGLNQTDIYVYNIGLPAAVVGKVYTVSAYFYNVDNSGYGGLGFTAALSPTVDFMAQPNDNLGMLTHAGGGAFYNLGIPLDLDYESDLLLADQWYFITFTAQVVGDGLFDISYTIANSDAAGNVGETIVSESQQNVGNASLGSAPAIYPYFCQVQDRFAYIDNFTTDYTTLPIQIASFTAIATGASTVTLDWKTVSEINNYGFNIERSPAGATPVWSTLGFVKGNGTTLAAHSYEYVDNTAHGSFIYRLKQIDLDNTVHYFEPVSVATGVTATAPLTFGLQQNFPNPFNPSTMIRYQVPGSGLVRLAVYDIVGREVAVLVNDKEGPGSYEVKFDGANVPSGMYIYRLTAGNRVESHSMLLIK